MPTWLICILSSKVKQLNHSNYWIITRSSNDKKQCDCLQ